MDKLKRFYWRLPYPLRVAAATARGWRIRQQRYGPETERLVEKALERESWNADRWATWQDERLQYLLHRAATAVPYYREQWASRRRAGDGASWELLENWPVLKKEAVRADPEAFLAEGSNPRKLIITRTSGTTGTPLRIYRSRRTVRAWYALHEARLRRWHGVSRDQRWGIFGGKLVAPFDQVEPPFWVYNAALDQVYFSTHHLSASTAASYADALRRYRPTHLFVYPSSARVLATAVAEQGLELPDSVEVVFSNAEQLLEAQRDVIGEAFGCPVVNTYGMVESAAAAGECGHGTMHLWPDAGVVEVILRAADAATGAGTGDVVATGLLNSDMPLIRYEVGDRAKLGRTFAAERCSCGRRLPELARLEGRTSDMILTPDGRSVFWLNPVFDELPVVESQIVQENRQELTVRVVPAPGWDDDSERDLRERLQRRVGEMHVRIESLDRIPRTSNGKLKPVVTRLDTGA